MNTRGLIFSAAALIALCVPPARVQAQSTTPSTTLATTPDKPESIAQRKDNQQDRIAQGVKSGQLTAGETAKLENQQQGINREVSGMRQANGGKLTKADKKAVNQQQNQASKNIYNKKHNARTRK
jgi:hypothetical protein